MEDETQDIPDITDVESAQYDAQADYEDYMNEAQDDQQFGSYPGSKPKDSIFTFPNISLFKKTGSLRWGQHSPNQ